MGNYSEDEVNLKRYLLGELPQDEQVLVEERLFLDGEYLLRLQALEDSLIDDYLYDELSLNERERFETQFLSKPGRNEDLRIAQALKRYCEAEAEAATLPPTPEPERAAPPPSRAGFSFLPTLFRRNPILRLSLAAAVIVILFVAAWLAFDVMRRRDQHQPVEAQQSPAQHQNESPEQSPQLVNSNERLANKSTAVEKGLPVDQQIAGGNSAGAENKQVAEQARQPQLRPRRSVRPKEREPSQTLAFLLLPGGIVRGEGNTKIVPLHSGISSVILKLPLDEEGNYDSYKATLKTSNHTIRTWTGLKSTIEKSIKLVPVPIPARLLRRQSYQIKLAGVTADRQTQEIATYPFQVEEK